MLVKSRGIVLNTFKYTEDKMISVAYTEAEGFRTFLLHRSKSARSKVRHTLFQPLSMLELEWNELSGKQMFHPKTARVYYAFNSLPYEDGKRAIGQFVAEFLNYALRGEPSSKLLFNYIEQSLEWLDECSGDYANFHLVFLMRLAEILGFAPNVEEYSEGCFFDMESSTFCLSQPSHPKFLMPEDAKNLPLLLRMSYSNMKAFKFSGAERSRLLTFMNDYFKLHLPEFPELKSLKVMREIFR